MYSINEDYRKFYFEVKDMFFTNMFNIIKNSYNKSLKSWLDYLKWYPKRLDVRFQIFLKFLWNRNLIYSKFIKVKLAQVALALAFNLDHIDSNLTNYAEKVLSREFEAFENSYNKWWNLRELVLELQERYMR